MAKLRIKQVRSSIGAPKNQKLTLKALGLRGIGKFVDHEDTESIRGMINTVKHKIVVEKI